MNDDTGPARIGFWDLPLDVISTHVLKSDFLPETADLGRLRAVSKGMRDAVDATGREIKKLSDDEAADLGHVSLLKDRHRRGVLGDERWLCAAAARKGDLEELKALRADKWPWSSSTFAAAATGGNLEMLKWLDANGCPWDEEDTWEAATKYGHVAVLQWVLENGWLWSECNWSDLTDMPLGGGVRPPRGAEVGAQERLPVGLAGVRERGVGRPLRGAEVGARE